MTEKEAYDYLDSMNLQWGRRDAEHIYVWEPGYCCRSDTERTLMKAGFILLQQEFDKICGKTMNLYKKRNKPKE